MWNTGSRAFFPPFRQRLAKGWGTRRRSDVLLSFEDVFNIPLAVQNSNYVHSVIVQEIINSDGFESRNRPGAQISENCGLLER